MSFNSNSSQMQLKDFCPLCTVNALFICTLKRTEVMFTQSALLISNLAENPCFVESHNKTFFLGVSDNCS